MAVDYAMNVIQTDLPGVMIVEPRVFGDPRGYFMETWQRERYRDAGLPETWVQDNLSRSSRGVLRGLHLQCPGPQGKLVSVLDGEVFDVAVDVRPGSTHFGRWTGALLSSENHRQFYVPEGFAHGFVVLSPSALFVYKCTSGYVPAAEVGVIWDDPDIGIRWPLADPTLSAKDAALPRLRDIPTDRLVPYDGG